MSPVERGCGDIRLMNVDDQTDEMVYAAHASQMVRFASGMVGPDDAPDVVAEAFVRIASSAVWSHAVNRKSLWAQAVVNESKSWVRSAARRRAREQRVHAATPSTIHVDEPERGVDDALDTLSVQQRAVVLCTYWLDLDPSKTAELLGVSNGTVRKQLARARARLKVALK